MGLSQSHLSVGLPSLEGLRQGEEKVKVRIGRKVAAMFGIPGRPEDQDAGAGRCWPSSYSAVTMSELLLGSPHVDPKGSLSDDGRVQDTGLPKTGNAPADVSDGFGEIENAWPISPTSVAGYGPDVKAAYTLTGANVVLDGLTQALKNVLTTMRFPDTRLLIGTTAMLISECFRGQPLLVFAGTQASRIQRAEYYEDAVHILAEDPSSETPWRVSRHDLPWSERERRAATGSAGRDRRFPIRETDKRPTSLDLVVRVWEALIDHGALEPRASNTVGIDQPTQASSQSSVIRMGAQAAARTLTERLIFGMSNEGAASSHILLRREDGGRPGYRDGDFYLDVVGVATRPARMLADRLTGIYFTEVREATAVWPPRFDIDYWRSRPALERRVALWAHHCAERFAVSGAWSESAPHRDTFNDRVTLRDELAAAAAEFFDHQDPLAVQLRVFHGCYQLEQEHRKNEDKPENASAKELRRVFTDYRDAVHDMIALHDQDKIRDSHVAESLQPTLKEVAETKEMAEAIDDKTLAADVAEFLEGCWSTYLEIQLGLLEEPAARVPGRCRPDPAAQDPTPQILHDLAAVDAVENPALAAILESSANLGICVAAFDLPEEPGALDLAIRIQENIHKRQEAVYATEGDWLAYRQAIVNEARLKMRRYAVLRDAGAPERDVVIKQVADLVNFVVNAELELHGLTRTPLRDPGRRMRFTLEDPEDALLAALADFLLHSRGIARERETGGLQQDIRSELKRHAPCVTERLQDSLWTTGTLATHRQLLDQALAKPLKASLDELLTEAVGDRRDAKRTLVGKFEQLRKEARDQVLDDEFDELCREVLGKRVAVGAG